MTSSSFAVLKVSVTTGTNESKLKLQTLLHTATNSAILMKNLPRGVVPKHNW